MTTSGDERGIELHKRFFYNLLKDTQSRRCESDRAFAFVTQILDLTKKLQDAKLGYEMTLLQRQTEATDSAINTLVYELYGLTEEEIGIVEGKNKI